MELAITAKFQSLLGVTYKTDQSDPVKYKSIYYWFMLWTLFGAEYGYLVVLPTWQWNFDAHVMRHAVVVTVAAMYVGQWIKCYTPWPRPSSPPVVRLEHIFASESTFPSTHASLGVSLGASFLYFSLQHYEISTNVGVFIACFSAINISLSRIYLGMHYLSDVIGGWAISILMLITVHPYILPLDALFLEYPSLAVLGAIVLAVAFPAPPTNENGLRADTCRLLGVLLATYLANKLFFELGLAQIPCPSPKQLIPLPGDFLTFSWISRCLLRFVIGFSIALTVRAISRGIIHSALMSIISSFPPSFTPPKGIQIKRWGPYEIPFYLISYTTVAFTIIFLTTYLYLITGLTSQGYLSQYPIIMKVPSEHPLDFYCVHNNASYTA